MATWQGNGSGSFTLGNVAAAATPDNVLPSLERSASTSQPSDRSAVAVVPGWVILMGPAGLYFYRADTPVPGGGYREPGLNARGSNGPRRHNFR